MVNSHVVQTVPARGPLVAEEEAGLELAQRGGVSLAGAGAGDREAVDERPLARVGPAGQGHWVAIEEQLGVRRLDGPAEPAPVAAAIGQRRTAASSRARSCQRPTLPMFSIPRAYSRSTRQGSARRLTCIRRDIGRQ